MNTAVLERPKVVSIVKSKRLTAKEELERAFAYGSGLAKKYGFTEEDVNNEIEAYRKEKPGNESSFRC
jgi:hypothetical protein